MNLLSDNRASRALAPGMCLLLLGVSLIGCTPDGAQDGTKTESADPSQAGEVIAIVNGEPLHQTELQLELGTVLAKNPPVSREDLRRSMQQAREALTNDLLQAQLAVEQGLDTDPAVRGRLAYYRIKVLADAQHKAFLGNLKVSEQALREEYGEPVQEYHLQHILVARPRDAEDLLARLAAGQDFSELARLFSADGATAKHDGDLGWLRLDQLPNYRMADAVRHLAPGAYASEAVEGPNGWHVLRLAEAPRPAANAVAFAQLPAEAVRKLSERVQQRELDRTVEQARKNARIEYMPDAEVMGGTPAVAHERTQG